MYSLCLMTASVWDVLRSYLHHIIPASFHSVLRLYPLNITIHIKAVVLPCVLYNGLHNHLFIHKCIFYCRLNRQCCATLSIRPTKTDWFWSKTISYTLRQGLETKRVWMYIYFIDIDTTPAAENSQKHLAFILFYNLNLLFYRTSHRNFKKTIILNKFQMRFRIKN